MAKNNKNRKTIVISIVAIIIIIIFSFIIQNYPAAIVSNNLKFHGLDTEVSYDNVTSCDNCASQQFSSVEPAVDSNGTLTMISSSYAASCGRCWNSGVSATTKITINNPLKIKTIFLPTSGNLKGGDQYAYSTASLTLTQGTNTVTLFNVNAGNGISDASVPNGILISNDDGYFVSDAGVFKLTDYPLELNFQVYSYTGSNVRGTSAKIEMAKPDITYIPQPNQNNSNGTGGGGTTPENNNLPIYIGSGIALVSIGSAIYIERKKIFKRRK